MLACRRLGYVVLTGIADQLKFSFSWKLSEASLTTAGLNFAGFDDQTGKPVWCVAGGGRPLPHMPEGRRSATAFAGRTSKACWVACTRAREGADSATCGGWP